MLILLDNLFLGLQVATRPENLMFCALGVTLGTILGILPGIGTLASISLLFPITFHLEPATSLIMLAGIYYGTTYGGSTASILLNLPGTPANAVAVLDGYPLAQKGRAGLALFMTSIASFFGGSIGIIVLIFFAPLLVKIAIFFGPEEYFSLIILGLIASATITEGSMIKGVASVVIGIMLGTVGTDIYTGQLRYTFGVLELSDGFNLVAVAMGIFGISEVISSMFQEKRISRDEKISFKGMLPDKSERKSSWLPMLRGAGIGSVFGALPGTGGTIAAFFSYAVEKRVARNPERFGKGAVEGLVGPEAANNAADQTAFIPTLALGIPGTASMALMLGVLIVNGIRPGPNLIADDPELFWGLVMSFWIGNIFLLVLNVPFISIFVRILYIPYHIMYPMIMVFICMGVLSINNNPFDVVITLIFGLVGYGFKVLDFPIAPLVLGFVLGPLLEEHFRRSMLLSRGEFDIFLASPLSAAFIALSVFFVCLGIWNMTRRTGRKNTAGNDQSVDDNDRQEERF
jgi:TctA family transporter